MAFADWSPNPSNNTSKPGINWSEGMLPSAVNDSARAMMADMATWLAAPAFPAGLSSVGVVVATTVRATGYTLGNTNETYIGYDQGAGYLLSFNGATNTYLPLRIIGSTIALSPGGTAALTVTGSGVTVPGTMNVIGALTQNGAQVWHLGNLNPSIYAPLSGAAFTGAVGVGITPSYRFHVNAGGAVAQFINTTGGFAPLLFSGDGGTTRGGLGAFNGSIRFGPINGTGTGVDNGLFVDTSGNGSFSNALNVAGALTQNGAQVWHSGNFNPSNYATVSQLNGKQDALGYTPYNSTNPAGYISSITGGMVTSALGYTPANRAGDTFTGTVAAPTVQLASGITVSASGGKAVITVGGSAVMSVDSSGNIRTLGNVIASAGSL